MKVTEEALKNLFQRREGCLDVAREACPDTDRLARASDGLLEPEERDALVDHLISCPDCAEEYRLLGPVREWAQEAVNGAPSSVVAMKPSPPRQWRIPHALAAGLAVVSVGLGAWSLSLREQSRRLQGSLAEQGRVAAEEHRRLEATTRQVGEFESRLAELSRNLDDISQPTPNVPIVDLLPRGAERGAEPATATVVEIPSRVGLVTLILNLGHQPAYPAYSADLLSRDGRTIWHGEGLTKSPENNFTLVLPARLVPAGHYRLRLQGHRRDGSGVPLEDYVFKVVSPPASGR
jgi:hypothetical protein